MWPLVKRSRRTPAEVDEEQRKVDKARRDMDEMHERLEEAVARLLQNSGEGVNE